LKPNLSVHSNHAMVGTLLAFSACCLIGIFGKNPNDQGGRAPYQVQVDLDFAHNKHYDEEACDSSTLLLQTSLEVTRVRSNLTDKPFVAFVREPRVSASTAKAHRPSRQFANPKRMPLHVEALMYGLFSALSYPIGAALGAILAPISKSVIAKWLAFGSGALVFAVATAIYGDSLFALISLSRKYGPFDQGCEMVHGTNVCVEKFWGMVQQIVGGIVGAFLYVVLERLIQQWSCEGRSFIDARWLWDAMKSSLDTDINGIPTEDVRTPRIVARAIWLGALIDTIPEAFMIGFMTNHHQLRLGFMFAIFLANFPAAFSGAAMLREREERTTICGACWLWSSLFLFTGLIAMFGSLITPVADAESTLSMNFTMLEGLAQGIAGGALLAMMAVVMLPEAYKGAGSIAGVYFVFGFGFSVGVQAVDSYLAGRG